MRTTKTVTIAAAVACLCVGAGIARAEQQTLSGTISDSMCGLSHKTMAEKQNSKISDRDCVIACLNYQTPDSPKLVVAAKDGTIYMIANQKFPGLIRRAGEPLSITGDVVGKTITVIKIEAVK
jgi:hypothetical protein